MRSVLWLAGMCKARGQFRDAALTLMRASLEVRGSPLPLPLPLPVQQRIGHGRPEQTGGGIIGCAAGEPVPVQESVSSLNPQTDPDPKA